MKVVLLSALLVVAAASSVSHVSVRRGEGLQSPHGPSGVDSFEYGVQHSGAAGYGGGIQYRQRVGYGRTELGQEFQDPYTGSAAYVRSQGNLQPSFGRSTGRFGGSLGLSGGHLDLYGPYGYPGHLY